MNLYATPSLCGSAWAARGTFPTFTTVLSIHVADPTPAVRRALPLYSHDDSRLPRPTKESPPTSPSLPAMPNGLNSFGAASFSLCYDLHVCLALLTGYDEMKPSALHTPSEVRCHSRFWRCPLPNNAGSQARWANGKFPIVGTFTRLVTAASEAAP